MSEISDYKIIDLKLDSKETIDHKLSRAIYNNDVDSVKSYIKAGADVNYDNGYKTALIKAANYGFIDIVIELIEAGADINQASENGETPLIYAICGKGSKTFEYLIKMGANPFIKNNDGQTALDVGIQLLEIWKDTCIYDACQFYDNCEHLSYSRVPRSLINNILLLSKYMKEVKEVDDE